jgi:hypothetical protein
MPAVEVAAHCLGEFATNLGFCFSGAVLCSKPSKTWSAGSFRSLFRAKTQSESADDAWGLARAYLIL